MRTAACLGMLVTSVTAAAQSPDERAFDATLEKVQSAQVEFVRGRPEPFKALWSHGDDVTLTGGMGGAIEKGWPAVSHRLDWASSQYSEGHRSYEEVSRYVSADLAYVVQIETIRFRAPGQTRETTQTLRATMVFRREPSSWRIVHRHADLATARPATQVSGDLSRAAADALLDLLVFGVGDVDLEAYPGDLRRHVENYVRRAGSYESSREKPPTSGVWELVHEAAVNYERRLVAVSDDARAPALAKAYVDRLRPCYEWEGFAGCPANEARFADEYQATHPGGPFTAYLPLLAAHRWLCAAEAYDYEGRPSDAERSRSAFHDRLSRARESVDLLVRTAAEALDARGRCMRIEQ